MYCTFVTSILSIYYVNMIPITKSLCNQLTYILTYWKPYIEQTIWYENVFINQIVKGLDKCIYPCTHGDNSSKIG